MKSYFQKNWLNKFRHRIHEELSEKRPQGEKSKKNTDRSKTNKRLPTAKPQDRKNQSTPRENLPEAKSHSSTNAITPSKIPSDQKPQKDKLQESVRFWTSNV